MKSVVTIGHFPIIDHLILGVAAHNDVLEYEHLELKTKLFTDWSSISEALKRGDINGAFLLFPLAFELFKRGLKSHLVLLGHREGQVLVARKGIERIEQLKDKTVFVPDKYSTHHILLHMLLKQVGMSLADVKTPMGFKHPREMVDMLRNGMVDAFVAAEPMGSEAVQQGIGSILALSHDINAHHVDCVLVMRDDCLTKSTEGVAELIGSLVKAGLFINAYPRQAAEIGEKFLGWPKKVLVKALTHDQAHILFWDLLPRAEEFAELQRVAVEEMGLWDKGIDLDAFIDSSFAQKAYREWVVNTRRETKDRGEERTLPGGFAEGVRRIKKSFGDDIAVAGLKFIFSGEKYPTGGERLQSIPHSGHIGFLEDVFSGKSFVVKTTYAKSKGLAFVQPEKGVEPDRVLLRLSQDRALKILQALHWGDRITEVKQYNENTAERDLFSQIESVSVVQQDRDVYFSLNADVFRFLVLLIHHF